MKVESLLSYSYLRLYAGTREVFFTTILRWAEWSQETFPCSDSFWRYPPEAPPLGSICALSQPVQHAVLCSSIELLTQVWHDE
jgi:hypothetical protein